MAVTKNDLKFYLTSSEPAITQTTASLSLGGYPSTTQFCPSTKLSGTIGITNANVTLLASLGSPTTLLINDELVTSTGSGTSLAITRSYLSTSAKFQLSGAVVYDISDKTLFNASLNENGKQYRCIAVRNEHATSAFKNLKFYIKNQSLNTSCAVKIAVEIPQTDIYSGTATAGSTISIVCPSIPLSEDDIIGNVVTVTSGDNEDSQRQIASFDEATGTLTFLTALATAISSGVTFRIENAPAQRTPSGLVSPATGTAHVSSFVSASTRGSAVGINMAGRNRGVDLYPNEVAYVWVERTLDDNSEAFENNRVIITATYTT